LVDGLPPARQVLARWTQLIDDWQVKNGGNVEDVLIVAADSFLAEFSPKRQISYHPVSDRWCIINRFVDYWTEQTIAALLLCIIVHRLTE